MGHRDEFGREDANVTGQFTRSPKPYNVDPRNAKTIVVTSGNTPSHCYAQGRIAKYYKIIECRPRRIAKLKHTLPKGMKCSTGGRGGHLCIGEARIVKIVDCGIHDP